MKKRGTGEHGNRGTSDVEAQGLELKSARDFSRSCRAAALAAGYALVLSLAACHPAAPLVAPAPVACATGQTAQQRDVLYFGQFGPDHAVIPDSSWQNFLATKVTPAFPDGFTVLAATGQWREASGSIIQEPSRAVVVLHPPSSAVDERIRSIISEYKTRFQQEAVLWERGAVCAAF